MNICLFSAEEICNPLDLRDERAVHLIKILHKQKGDSFSAGIIGGKAGTAVITDIVKETLTAPNGKQYEGGKIYFTFTPEADGKELFPLKMIIGFPRPIQLKRLLRDMAGLGVSEVHLTGTELGEKSYLESNLATTDAGYKMLLDGTVQAASTHVPLLVKHESLEECIKALVKDAAGGVKDGAGCAEENADFANRPALVCLDNVDAAGSLTEWLGKNVNGRQNVVAAIGSERGWSKKERQLLEQNGFVRLSMGSRVLRTETASTVAASLILSAMGALD